MLKWMLTVALALVVLSALAPAAARYGIGRLPGDVTVRWRGRDWYLPFTSTLIASALMTLIARLL